MVLPMDNQQERYYVYDLGRAAGIYYDPAVAIRQADACSGVVVDEEVANMMLYNKSLNAASRLMTAMDEALDVIINKTGLVGR